MGRKDKKGNSTYEHGTYMKRRVMETDAWRAMSPKAQVLYIWLRFEWKGSKFNNNGKIQFSCRQAACRIGIGVNAAMRAFHELQAKGFVVITRLGALGVEGAARGPTYELTEIGLPNKAPRNLYRTWKVGSDFDVRRHQSRCKKSDIP